MLASSIYLEDFRPIIQVMIDWNIYPLKIITKLSKKKVKVKVYIAD
jgi:uncharacterized protein related to proFAR isomerase